MKDVIKTFTFKSLLLETESVGVSNDQLVDDLECILAHIHKEHAIGFDSGEHKEQLDTGCCL